MALSIEHANFIAVWVETLLYGIYFVLFVTCFCILCTRPIDGRRPVIVLAMLFSLYIFNTGHLVATMYAADQAFFRDSWTPATYFNDRGQVLSILTKFLYGMVLIIGDGLLIYRCWIIWQRNWWIIVAPMSCLVGGSITGWMLIFVAAQLKPDENLFRSKANYLTPITFTLSMLTNLLTTILMVYRIRAVCKSSALVPSIRSLRCSIIATLVESGAIVPLALIATIILFWSHSGEQALLIGPLCQLIGIVPTLTMLQVNLGYSQYDLARGHSQRSQNISRASGTTIRFACPITGSAEYAAPASPQKFHLDLEMDGSSSNRLSQTFINDCHYDAGYPKSQMPSSRVILSPSAQYFEDMKTGSSGTTVSCLLRSKDNSSVRSRQSQNRRTSTLGRSSNDGDLDEPGSLGTSAAQSREIRRDSELTFTMLMSQSFDTTVLVSRPDSVTLPESYPVTPHESAIF